MVQCSDEEMRQLIAAADVAAGDGLAHARRLIETYPDDARLHFVHGSLLAGMGRAIEAHAALSQAVALAPDFALARFQLGFFELTSAEAARALTTWEPLDRLPAGHHLACFVEGLTHLIHDRFAETVASLRAGIAVNLENAPLNRDMQLIVDQCTGLLASEATSQAAAETSATSFLLGQLGGRGTTH